MFKCIYLYIYICIFVNVYRCIYGYGYMDMDMYIYICIIYIYMYIYIYSNLSLSNMYKLINVKLFPDLIAVALRSRYGLWSQRWPNAFGRCLCLRTVCLGAMAMVAARGHPKMYSLKGKINESMGVSTNGGTPIWMIYKGTSH